jgi:DNA (cytosine-5)-methyltransferase 1
MNYYNEHDPKAAAWLRELIAQNLIPAGEVDERSIIAVSPGDLQHYTQCHFFAGIGGWSLALQLAGWPATRPVGTGSCPCQPFSAAGKGLGEDDERHLWPVFFHLIRDCRNLGQPWAFTVFGEQVANAIGKGWLDGVSADLESEGYACGAVVLGAHSVGAPHIRQRLYWLADSQRPRREASGLRPEIDTGRQLEQGRPSSGLADATGARCDGTLRDAEGKTRDETRLLLPGAGGETGGLADTGSERRQQIPRSTSSDENSNGTSGWIECEQNGNHQPPSDGENNHRIGEPNSHGRRKGIIATQAAGHGDTLEPAIFWADSRLILCRDGKHRRIPTEPAIFPLADGLPYKLARRRSIRPALLRGAGNAIVPQDAAVFIQAYLDAQETTHLDPAASSADPGV